MTTQIIVAVIKGKDTKTNIFRVALNASAFVVMFLVALNHFNLPVTTALSMSSSSSLLSSSYPSHMREKIASSIAKGERRARERTTSSREVCSGCSRPPILCLCNYRPPQGKPLLTSTRILILQHPNEYRKKNFSTVPLIQLILENVKVKVGYTFDPDVCFSDCGEKKPLLLYPSDDAIDLNSVTRSWTTPQLENDNGLDIGVLGEELKRSVLNQDIFGSDDSTLVIIDGTWNEAKRMVRDSPGLLERCQAVKFTSPDVPSIYHAVRKEPEKHCLSTLEACSRTLQLLEKDQNGDLNNSANAVVASYYLERILQKHVDTYLNSALASDARHKNSSARKMHKKNDQWRKIEKELFSSKKNEDVLCRGDHPKVDTSKENNNNGNASTTIAGKELPFAQHYGSIKLQDEATIRLLRRNDAPLINSWWKHQSTSSLAMISRCIDDESCYMACIGVEINGKLKACILRYLGGALGMLYVDPLYRRRGYGSALLRTATEAILHYENQTCWSLIMDGNESSEALFEKEGYTREDPSRKKGHGLRRANRKWIKVLLPGSS